MHFNREKLLWLRWLGPAIVLIAVMAAFGTLNRPASASPSNPPPPPAPALVQATAVPPLPFPTAQTSNPPSGPTTGRVTGILISANQASLAFQMSGVIKQFLVKEGDKVKKGDVLASLETAAMDLQVSQAQAALTLAQARLAQTQKGGTPDQVAAANQALATAKANYAKVLAGPTADDLAAPKANLDRAKAALDQAQAAYDKAGGASNPYVGMLPTTLALQDATAAYQAALGAYNLARNHPTATDLATAAGQLEQAEAAAAQVNPTPETLAIAQAQVDQAQAALDQAKQTVAIAKIVAPFDGTVVSIVPHVGENASTSATAIVLADLSKMQVQANVDEITLRGLKVGQPATLSVEALNTGPLTGHISKVGMYGTSSGGVISVPVWIDVDPTNAPLFPGLSATVTFENGQ